MSHPSPSGDTTFHNLKVSAPMLAVLNRLQFTKPTPIQTKAIPIALDGKDLIGIAQTGTGKTLAFAVPMIEHVLRTKKQGLVILPTRELAFQLDELLQKIGQPFGIRRALLVGGASSFKQVQQIHRQPHIIVGTPGRINDHLDNKILQLKNVGILVLDEADRMLDMGFEPQIKQILHHVPKQRQTMLFSATMPVEIVTMAKRYMHLPVRVEVAPAGTVAERINQELFIIPKDHKPRLLDKLLHEYSGTVLVFSRTKYGARKICRSIQHMGHKAAEIHSNLSLSQRRKALDGFKTGRYRVLVATDIASRGIDVTNIELVINYDLPDNPDDYVHRIGRTGRAGKAGQAITFVAPEQRSKVKIIERLVRTSLKVSPVPALKPQDTKQALPHQGTRTTLAPRHSFGRPFSRHPRQRNTMPARAPRKGGVRIHS